MALDRIEIGMAESDIDVIEMGPSGITQGTGITTPEKATINSRLAVLESQTASLATSLAGPNLGHRTGTYISSFTDGLGSAGSENVTTAFNILLVPVYIREAVSISALDTRVVTASAGRFVRLGLYRWDRANSRLLLVTNGSLTVATDTTGWKSAAFAPLAVTPGWYWIATCIAQVGPAVEGSVAASTAPAVADRKGWSTWAVTRTPTQAGNDPLPATILESDPMLRWHVAAPATAVRVA